MPDPIGLNQALFLLLRASTAVAPRSRAINSMPHSVIVGTDTAAAQLPLVPESWTVCVGRLEGMFMTALMFPAAEGWNTTCSVQLPAGERV